LRLFSIAGSNFPDFKTLDPFDAIPLKLRWITVALRPILLLQIYMSVAGATRDPLATSSVVLCLGASRSNPKGEER